jgi:uncharacterized protein YodC (DUF2158 family)
MEAYKVGDVVTLRSGGPKMTIKRFVGQNNDTWQGKANEQVLKIQGYKDGDLVCIWFEGTQLKEGVFPVETVQPA